MIKVGVIGTGRWGENHVRCYKNLGKDVFIFDIDKEKCKEMSKKYNATPLNSMEDLIKEVDAISIVTPSNTHFEIAKKCIESNKHLMIEKPLTLSSKEAKELIELTDKKNLVLATGHVFRFTDTMRNLKYNFKTTYKNINYINAKFFNEKPPRKDANIIFNLGIHLFDILDFITEKQPKEILCQFKEDFGSIILTYDNFSANLQIANNCMNKEREIIINGNDYNNNPIHKIFNFGESEREPVFEEIKEFCYSIENNLKPVHNARNALLCIKLCELAEESNKIGKKIIV